MHRFAPPLLALLVTVLLAHYGRFEWSWTAGPIAGALLFLLGRAVGQAAAADGVEVE